MATLGIGFALPAGQQVGANTQLAGHLRTANAWLPGLLNGSPLELRAELSSLRHKGTPFAHYRAFLKCPWYRGRTLHEVLIERFIASLRLPPKVQDETRKQPDDHR